MSEGTKLPRSAYLQRFLKFCGCLGIVVSLESAMAEECVNYMCVIMWFVSLSCRVCLVVSIFMSSRNGYKPL